MFQFVTIFVALVAIGSATPSLKEGRLSPASIEDYPYQVSIEQSGEHICSGAIITDSIILTSAACTHSLAASDIKIRAGSSRCENGGIEVNVKAIVRHPRYMKTRKDYDIAVIVLKETLPFGTNIKSIELPNSRTAPSQGTVGIVSGWGLTSEIKSIDLQSVEVKIAVPINCKNAYAPHIIYITDRMFCATHTADHCEEDYGSPLVIGNTLVGISAWEQKCGSSRYPGIYTDVASLKKWIIETIDETK